MSDKKISEGDVIDFLVERRNRLVVELESIDTTIAGLNSQLDTIGGVGPALKRPISNPRKTENKKDNERRKIELPTEYKSSDSIDKRVLFVLSELGKASRDEILDHMMTKYEPDADYEKIKASAKVRLSQLLKGGQIKGKRKGRWYEYSLS